MFNRDLMDKNRQEIVDKLLAEFEKGEIPWHKCWKATTTISSPLNAVTNIQYKGINKFTLSLEALIKGYSDHRWCTFKQAKENNWKIKKDEKATKIEFIRYYDNETKRDLDWDWWNSLTQEEKAEFREANRISVIFKPFYVFNADQIEGIPKLQKNNSEQVYKDLELEKMTKDIIDGMQIAVFHDGGDRAYYVPLTDTIHVPKPGAFEDEVYYNSVVLHELSHATGHTKRMNRDLSGKYGSESYAKEEIRAELSSFFLSQEISIKFDEKHFKNHVAYLQSWIDALKNDKNELFKAIKDADEISRFMIELKQEIEVDFSYTKQKKKNMQL